MHIRGTRHHWQIDYTLGQTISGYQQWFTSSLISTEYNFEHIIHLPVVWSVHEPINWLFGYLSSHSRSFLSHHWNCWVWLVVCLNSLMNLCVFLWWFISWDIHLIVVLFFHKVDVSSVWTFVDRRLLVHLALHELNLVYFLHK